MKHEVNCYFKIHVLTEADHVPYPGLWGGGEHHVDQPEGVENFNAHPGEGGEHSVVEPCCHPGAHILPSHISQDSS